MHCCLQSCLDVFQSSNLNACISLIRSSTSKNGRRIGDSPGETGGGGRNRIGVDVVIIKPVAVHSIRMVNIEFSSYGLTVYG